MTNAEQPRADNAHTPKKVVCRRDDSERHEVDQRIAFLVQCLLDHGFELCGAEVREDRVEVAFYESSMLNWFYNLAVPASPGHPLHKRAVGEATPEDSNWWIYVDMIPPDPAEEIEDFDSVIAVAFPYSDYDEVLLNVRTAADSG